MNILKCLDHPNILRVYELYQDDIYYYLITEFNKINEINIKCIRFCSGGQLFDKIKSMSSFSERMAADYMK